MQMGEIATMITTVGFPIVACCAMGWYVTHITETFMDKLNEMESKHKEEVDSLSTAVENNTIVMEKILTKLGE